MSMTIFQVLLACALVLFVGCGGSTGPAGESAGDDGNGAVEPSAPPYDGPPVQFTVTTEGEATTFAWSVTAPTGGWQASFEGAQTNPSTNHAVIRVVLIRPGPDEIVTQALETIEGDYRHGRLVARSAELVIRTTTHAAKEEGEYRSAATWPAD
jgi:hypothetical protein